MTDPTYLVVIPSIAPAWTAACLDTLQIPREHVLVVDNTIDNKGVSGSWNLGVDRVLADRLDWLVIMSASMRFGFAGGMDFIEALAEHPDAPVVEASGAGWHLIAFARSTLEAVGWFDENFYPGYWEDIDYSVRMQRTPGVLPLTEPPWWPRVDIDGRCLDNAHGIKHGGVKVDLEAMAAYYATKWGGPKDAETFATPFGSQPVSWWPPTAIHVVWPSYDVIPARGKWDQHMVTELVEGRLGATATRFVQHEQFSDVPGHVDGVVVVLHGCHHTRSEQTAALNADLAKFSWVVLLVTSDEQSQFPHEHLYHPNLRLWWMTPDPARLPANAKYLHEGYPPQCRPAVAAAGIVEKTLDWVFIGQVTHQRRRDCVAALRPLDGGLLVETEAFATGLPYDEYIRLMMSAKVAPCPSGAVTPDSFRVYEALEAGAIPILDGRNPDGTIGSEVWTLMLGADHPLPIVDEWSAAPAVIERLLAGWERESAVVREWWESHKQRLVDGLDEEIRGASGSGVLADSDRAFTAAVERKQRPSLPKATPPSRSVAATPLSIAYLGNFEPEHSTENHVARAFTALGHRVYPLQENEPSRWKMLRRWAKQGWGGTAPPPDLVLRTRTWEDPAFQAHETVEALRGIGVPTIGFHLDRWWGLNREGQVADQAFFQCDLVITADGGHQDEFARAGVNHVWLPPGVSERECLRDPRPRVDLDGRVAFVGATGGYHTEWPWRTELVAWLRRTFGPDFVEVPGPGKPAIRGQELVDIYASNAVFVGDSCLAGGATRYWSDRIPETLGRGGLLIHPTVEGLDEHFTPGKHLLTFEIGDFDGLAEAISTAQTLLAEDGAAAMRVAAREHVLANHTYEVRAGQIIDLCRERGLLP